jgi:hypothetical protein
VFISTRNKGITSNTYPTVHLARLEIDMNLLSLDDENLYGTWTAITFGASLVVLLFTAAILLWGGFGDWRANAIAATNFFSSVCLFFGLIKFRSTKRVVALITLLISAIFLALYFYIFKGPNSFASWLIVAVYTIQIFLSFLRFTKLRTSEATTWPQ